ncbi:MAG: hypothetical protein RMA76_39955 [Deltaproteobacteria bacterium]|jgi:hypothetical protein
MRTVLRALTIAAALFASSSAWAQDEPGGPRIPEPGGPRIPPPPPPAPPPPTPTPEGPGAFRSVESEAPDEESEEVPKRVFRALLSTDFRFAFGSGGGVLDTREIDDASGLSLSLGLLPSDKFLLGVRGSVLFGPMNRDGWGEALRGGVLSSTGLEIGPLMQLRFRLPATFLLYLGADAAYATMRSSAAATFGVTFRGVTLAPGEQFAIVYKGWSVGGTLGLAWRGISSELRYVRTEWGGLSVGGTSIETGYATDQLVLSFGFALRI